MRDTHPTLPANAPPSQDCGVVELRQYTLHPGRRDALIELFDREFVETQEATGMRVIGQFRDLEDADRFVWMRGFADMAARAAALPAFYGGPVWAAHRDAANATMIDSDDVLLLRPAWPGAGIVAPVDARAPAGSTHLPAGVLDATVFPLACPPAGIDELLELARSSMTRVLRDGGADPIAWYVTEPTPNDYPRLPVREGEHVLVGLAMFRDLASLDAWAATSAWTREIAPQLARWLGGAPQALRLAPTTRSALHA